MLFINKKYTSEINKWLFIPELEDMSPEHITNNITMTAWLVIYLMCAIIMFTSCCYNN